jgi:hypothetical protein
MKTDDRQTTTTEETAALSEADAPLATTRARLRKFASSVATRGPLRDRSVRSALFAFTLSRTIVLVIFVLVGWMTTAPYAVPGYVEPSISVQKAPIAQLLREEVLTADVNWYVGIAQQGYEKHPFNNDVFHNWAFFPLFPLLLRLAYYVTGEFVLTGMALSHVFFLLALFLLHRVSLLFGLSADDADRSLFYLAVFPTSYFFSLPLPESLFLMLTVGSFYFTKREQWWLAGVCGLLASATRPFGVLLLPALALLYWQMYRPLTRRSLRKDALALLLIPGGLFSFMLYLHAITGNAFAFQGVQATWGRRAGLFLSPLYDYLRQPGEIALHWDFRLLNFLAVSIALACGAVLLKRRQFPLAAYTLLTVLVALSSGLLQSQARYAMVIFPVYMVLATLGRRAKVDQLIRAVFLVFLALMTAMFAAHFTLALS